MPAISQSQQMPTRAPAPSVNALHWIGAVMAFGATVWYWMDFSGPFRWMVDLQVALTGRFYWEPLALALLFGALLCGVVFVANLLDPLVPRLSLKAWGMLFVLVSLIVSGGALMRAWHLWNAPTTGTTHRYAPVRDLDLDQLGAALLPASRVRLVGRLDRDEQVRLHQEPRGYRVYQPIGGLRRAADALPVPVVAFCSSRWGRDCMGDKLEGWLVPDGLEGRDFYRLRRAGLLAQPHHYVLYPGLPQGETWVSAGPGDPGEAAAIVMWLAFFWFTVIFAWVKTPRTSTQAAPTSPAEPVEADEAAGGRGGLYAAAGAAAVMVLVLVGALSMLRTIVNWIF